MGMVMAQRWKLLASLSPPRRFTLHGSKWAAFSAKWECHRCGQGGHIARNCMAPSPVASGREQGHSSAARQQRPPHKGNNRSHRGAGGEGSSEGSGSSRFTSTQQQHQALKNNPGSSGSGSGGAAPQRIVQVDASSTTASAPAVRDACRCTGGEFTTSVVCWLVVLSSRRAV